MHPQPNPNIMNTDFLTFVEMALCQPAGHTQAIRAVYVDTSSGNPVVGCIIDDEFILMSK